jgi:hypothetical protein
MDSRKFPAWSKWEPALALLFLQTAKSILTNDGVLALLYADTFENVHDVAKGLHEINILNHSEIGWLDWTVLFLMSTNSAR